ncbi:MetQ/NlpA family ABC transporter substrate-binding protein [Clostridium sp. AM33-3]|jgi:D-methionine transport system substrate-binding protein|uniref:MetQ/NlpA family ABC transporter substrate-binding protein n=1 Tax=Clostridium sp. AM33-3 TaxID=2292304 RepID=UPI000E540A4E|nr:MetQ/NlpA family ABC transporter substrate-binding protein [Clostridium sp. AM33-3]RHT21636.1 ABC transporter substrate-binding protein [Clostridium sp. AM33-3]
MKKNIGVIAAAFLAAAALTACGGSKPAETTAAETGAEAAETTAAEAESREAEAKTDDLKELTVGASPAPHAEILEAAREELAKKGYDLKIVEYTDYVQPNLALDAGDLDANYFQHLPYLEQFNEERGTKLVSAGKIHYEPFGIYAGKTATLDALADGAKVAVPNDATNEARALLLLEAQGLLKLADGAGLKATKTDIVENPKNLDILEVEAAQVPRSLPDVDIAVINGNYAIEAGLKVSDALAVEASDSEAATTYGNVVAVQEGKEDDEKTKALIEALTSDAVKEYMEQTYEGAVVPLF